MDSERDQMLVKLLVNCSLTQIFWRSKKLPDTWVEGFKNISEFLQASSPMQWKFTYFQLLVNYVGSTTSISEPLYSQYGIQYNTIAPAEVQ